MKLQSAIIIFLSVLACPLAAQIPAQTSAQTPMQTSAQTQQGINDPRANAILQKARKNLLAAKNIQIEFSYTEKNKEQKALLLAAGNNYLLKMPEQEIYCDGKTLYIYDIKANEVNIYTYSPEKDDFNPLSSIKDYEKRFRAKYIREETFKGLKCDIIDLVPLDGRTAYYRLRFHINKTTLLPERFESDFKNSDNYIFTVLSLKTNIQIDANAFTFDSKKHPNILENDMR
ncbi:MAG: outer membrane lipoprotein carrier protein LolA [Bacteroidales bacterium]|jgi:outer membrane lipoprotein-sorting protein|nr:outer membrane lipoprotein carrier protein LolA [Bacteroidales bacterium]